MRSADCDKSVWSFTFGRNSKRFLIVSGRRKVRRSAFIVFLENLYPRARASSFARALAAA
jgi:hypothetical protein